MVLVADMVSIFGAKVLFEILMFMNIKVFSMFMNIMYNIGGSATAHGCS